MAYDITKLKSDLTAELHGTTTNQIVNLNGLIYRAARDMLLEVDPNETIRISPIASPVFNSIYDYAVPTDLKGDRVIDIFPQVNRDDTGVVQQVYNQYFDLNKASTLRDSMTIIWNSAAKSMRLSVPSLTPPTPLNTCESLTANGTWAATTSASSLAVDNVNFVSSSGALKFNLAAAGSTGYLENSTMSSVDISSWLNQGYLFLYTFLPTGTDFTNVNLRFGSSSSNYYSINATQTQAGTVFQNGWNLLSFPWVNATVVGSPSSSAINYLRVTWTYNGTAQTAVRLDQICASLGTILQMEYYSKYLFRDSSTGAFAEEVASDSDLINLDTESYNLLLYKLTALATQQQQGLDAMYYDGAYFEGKYQKALERYQALYKSQVQKPQQVYYKLPTPQRFTRIRRGF